MKYRPFALEVMYFRGHAVRPIFHPNLFHSPLPPRVSMNTAFAQLSAAKAGNRLFLKVAALGVHSHEILGQ
jgi:hypothetical protein